MRISYNTNGTGRDTYINVNSGGLFKSYEPFQPPPVTSFVQKKIPNAPPAPRMVAKAVHY